jgi:ABC-type spermidine/putrescine transport system permease subunit I
VADTLAEGPAVSRTGALTLGGTALAVPCRAERVKWLLLTPGLVILSVFLLIVATGLVVGFRPTVGTANVGDLWTWENYRKFFTDPFYYGYLTRSVVIAAYCTAVALVLGYPVAFVMAMCNARWRAVIAIIVVSQFFTAYVIRSFAMMTILGRDGLINRLLLDLGLIDAPLRIMFSGTAVAIGLVLVSLPLMILPIYSAIAAIPANVDRAAQSLGANALRTFWHVTVPLSMPGVASGCILVYLFCFSSYVVPAILGGVKFPMIGNLIVEKALEARDFPFAAAAAGAALLTTALVVFVMQKAFDRSAMRGRA